MGMSFTMQVFHHKAEIDISVTQGETSGDHQSHYDSLSERHGCLYKVWTKCCTNLSCRCWVIEIFYWILVRHFSQKHSGAKGKYKGITRSNQFILWTPCKAVLSSVLNTSSVFKSEEITMWHTCNWSKRTIFSLYYLWLFCKLVFKFCWLQAKKISLKMSRYTTFKLYSDWGWNCYVPLSVITLTTVLVLRPLISQFIHSALFFRVWSWISYTVWPFQELLLLH